MAKQHVLLLWPARDITPRPGHPLSTSCCSRALCDISACVCYPYRLPTWISYLTRSVCTFTSAAADRNLFSSAVASRTVLLLLYPSPCIVLSLYLFIGACAVAFHPVYSSTPHRSLQRDDASHCTIPRPLVTISSFVLPLFATRADGGSLLGSRF